MKPFTWKIVICLVPLLISAAIVGKAFNDYWKGRGGFKLGVDLVGGTILIYEVDPAKLPDGWDDRQAQELARRLKSRIDPSDLYNMSIRAVSKTRFEIIMPTGGEHQRDAEEKVWQALLAEVESTDKGKFKIQSYIVPEGHKTRLLAEIVAQYPRKDDDPKTKDDPKTDIEKTRKFIDEKYPLAQSAPADKVKWQALLDAAKEEYPPRNYEVGRGRILELANQIQQQHPEVPLPEIRKVVGADEIKKKSKRGQALTTEQVQEKKELIAQQGSLEFRILARKDPDSAAISATKETFRKLTEERDAIKKRMEAGEKNVPANTLDTLAFKGQPPPAPVSPDGGRYFDTPLGKYSYMWVEVGSYYRQDHGLANPRDTNGNLIPINNLTTDAKLVPQGKEYENWLAAAQARQEGNGLLDGIPAFGDVLIYTRDIKTPRLAEKDRDKKYEYYILVRDRQEGQQGPWQITGDLLSSARPGMEGNVSFNIKSDKADLFREFTTLNKGQLMAIVLDGMVESAATIQSAISSSGQITGNFDRQKIDDLVKILRSGSLPATLKPQPVSENTMGPTLGADTIRRGAWSIIWAFGFVLLFMLVYYEFAGLVACVALMANLLLTLAFMVVIDATFTLPGLAGLVLMLGMAVDANILIYERLREERDRGATLAMALRNGYDRALPTIIDTHLTSIFTAVVLYVVGNDQLKGFGISLTVGLIISLFTSLYVTRVMFDGALMKGWLKKLNMRRLLTKPNINFMAIRYYWFTATIILTIVGAALFIYRAEAGLNIDFVGGTAYGGELIEPMDISDVSKLLKDSGLPDLSVEQIFITAPGYTVGTKSKLFTVRTSEKDRKKVEDAIRKTLGQDGAKKLKTIYVSEYDFLPDNKTATLAFVDPPGGEELPDDPKVWKTWKPGFASRAQVSMLLAEQFENRRKTLDDLASEKQHAATVASNEAKKFGQELEEQRKKGQVGEGLADLEKKQKAAQLLASNLGKEAEEVRGRQASLDNAAKSFAVEGVGQENDGRFQWMELRLLDPIKDRSDLEAVLASVQSEFARSPQPERLENFDSQLAAETQLRALYAILASWGAILLYLWFRFGNWTFGAAAVLCLIHDLFFTLGMIAGCHFLHDTAFGRALGLSDFKIDLPAVAALLTLVGYSVSDTIVVFDRIREVRGKNPELTPKMINDSVNQTLSRTLLTAFSVWLVVIVLYAAGGDGVHLFAFVMVVGVIVGTYSSIYIASPLLLIFGEGRAPAGAAQRAPAPRESGTPA